MVADNITIFEEGSGIEIMVYPQYNIRQLYEKLVGIHNKKIYKAVINVI